ncbi:MAG TPA: hypothetical protein VHY37_02195 [Tepidisphaeraceae bacterium]|jgi:hypothetical protein|nr:hypothetical protein [Tepidisphaeraceae bacterium]
MSRFITSIATAVIVALIAQRDVGGVDKGTVSPAPRNIFVYWNSLYRSLSDGGRIYRCTLLDVLPENRPGARLVFGKVSLRVSETIWGKEEKSLDLRYLQRAPDLSRFGNLWPVYPPSLRKGTELCVVTVPDASVPGTAPGGGDFPALVLIAKDNSKTEFDWLRRAAEVEAVLQKGPPKSKLKELSDAAKDQSRGVRQFADDALTELFMDSSPLAVVDALEDQALAYPSLSCGDVDLVGGLLSLWAREPSRSPATRRGATRALADLSTRITDRGQSARAAEFLAYAVTKSSFSTPRFACTIGSEATSPFPASDILSPDGAKALAKALASELGDPGTADAVKIDLDWIAAGVRSR